MQSETRQPSPWLLIAGLYVSQAIPLGFFTVAMPAILRDAGVHLEKIGLLAALALPWLIKFLWAPVVDRFGSRRFGHYRSWIVPLQLLNVACVLAIALTDIHGGLLPLVLAGGAFMLLAATQDIATDGLAVHVLGRRERGPGNGIQVGGYYLGQILGGGAMLLIFGRFGWTVAIVAMAVFLALPIVPALRFREPEEDSRSRPERLDYGSLGRFFRQPGSRVWIPVLLLFRAPEVMALTMLNPMLVDRGHSLTEIGLLLGLVGSLASLGGAMVGGLWINSFGRKRSLVVFTLLQTTSVASLALLASGRAAPWAVYAVCTSLAFAGGMATTALYTHMMDRSSTRNAATDFTLQQSLAAIGPIIGAAVSGFSAARLGYAGHFVAACGVGLTCVALTAWGLTVEMADDRDARALVGAARPRR